MDLCWSVIIVLIPMYHLIPKVIRLLLIGWFHGSFHRLLSDKSAAMCAWEADTKPNIQKYKYIKTNTSAQIRHSKPQILKRLRSYNLSRMIHLFFESKGSKDSKKCEFIERSKWLLICLNKQCQNDVFTSQEKDLEWSRTANPVWLQFV